ncbi:hypothetical protein PFISCL1PPCAC_28759, partial [Pristionchus fissidentatus]
LIERRMAAMNSTNSIVVLPPLTEIGGGLKISPNIWIFLVAFTVIIALFALVGLIKYLRTKQSSARTTDVRDEFMQSKDVTPREIFSVESGSTRTHCLPTPPPTAKTSPTHNLSPPEVIITPPTPIPGEEERTKTKRSYSLEDF